MPGPFFWCKLEFILVVTDYWVLPDHTSRYDKVNTRKNRAFFRFTRHSGLISRNFQTWIIDNAKKYVFFSLKRTAVGDDTKDNGPD